MSIADKSTLDEWVEDTTEDPTERSRLIRRFIADAFRTRMAVRNITQRGLAKKAGMKYNSLTRFFQEDKSSPSLEAVCKVAHALGFEFSVRLEDQRKD